MYRQVIEENNFNTLTQVMYGCKTTWVSLSFLVDCNSLLLYLFHYLIYHRGIYIYIFCCIIIIPSVLPGTMSHFKKIQSCTLNNSKLVTPFISRFALMSSFSIAKTLICIYLAPLLSLLYPVRACTFTYIDRCPIKSTHFFYTYIQCYTYIVTFENVVLS